MMGISSTISNRGEPTRRPPDSHVSLPSLRQVLAVAEHLNFRHAAAALGTSQSCVSTRIKLLEDELGVPLFERRHRGVRLTEAGSVFVEEIAIGIRHLDHAIATVGVIASGAMGHVRAGIPYPIVGGFLADLRHRFRRSHPDVDLLMSEDGPSQTMRHLREGEIDIAFVVGAIDGADYHSRRLWAEPLVVAVPTGHRFADCARLCWADLAPETFLVPTGRAGLQLQDHIIRRAGENGWKPRLQLNDVGRDTLMHMVAGGEGIKLTTQAAAHVPFPGVAFREIADEAEPAWFSAVWSPRNRSPALRQLVDLADAMSRSIATA